MPEQIIKLNTRSTQNSCVIMTISKATLNRSMLTFIYSKQVNHFNWSNVHAPYADHKKRFINLSKKMLSKFYSEYTGSWDGLKSSLNDDSVAFTTVHSPATRLPLTRPQFNDRSLAHNSTTAHSPAIRLPLTRPSLCIYS